MGLIKTIKKISGSAKDVYNRAYSFFKDRLPYRVKQYVESNVNKRVEKMRVYRQPIQSIISKLFNIISLTKWDEAKNRLGYDDIFHLYIIVELNDDMRTIIEKNQDINVGDPNPEKFNGQYMDVDLKGRQPLLIELLDNTRKFMGNNTFYSYNPKSNNCQDFIYSMLRSNNLLTPQLEQFVKQDAGELLKTLPEYAETIANATTKGASYINRFLQTLGFKGFKDGGLVV